MNFREKIEQARERLVNTGDPITGELEDNFDCEYFATDNIKSLPACVDLRLPDGQRKALPYTHFVEIDFDNFDGIEITTNRKKIKIIGRDLGKLFDYLVAYRVRFIQANSIDDNEDSGLWVKEILIEEFIP